MTTRLFSALALITARSLAVGAPVNFAHEVKPILAKYCYDCHGPEKQKNSLRLDLKAHAFKGGEDHGSPIKPGDGRNSVLVKFVSGEDEENLMPPKGKRLTKEEVATLQTWIDQGATWPEDGVAVNDPLNITVHTTRQVSRI